MIKIVEGDILQATENIIAHQVNCMGVFGAGLAKQIALKYPKAKQDYLNWTKQHKDADYLDGLLGTCLLSDVGKDKYIIHMYGQYNYGRNQTFTNYDKLKQCMVNLREHAKQNNLTVAIPHGIGCGLAGGDWDIVRFMIDEVFEDYNVTLYRVN